MEKMKNKKGVNEAIINLTRNGVDNLFEPIEPEGKWKIVSTNDVSHLLK
jgi:hypothetical protein